MLLVLKHVGPIWMCVWYWSFILTKVPFIYHITEQNVGDTVGEKKIRAPQAGGAEF